MQANHKLTSNRILSIVLGYAAIAALWILLSDKAVEWLFPSPEGFALASTLKGWLFIAVTALLLYGMLHRMLDQGAPAAPQRPYASRLKYPFLLLALIIVLLTSFGIVFTIRQAKEKEVARVQAIADLKTRQIADWLKERKGDAELLKSSFIDASLLQRVSGKDDLNSKAALLERFKQISKGFSAISLMSAHGEPLWSSSKATLPPPLHITMQYAAQTQQIQRAGPYLNNLGQPSLDFIIPLPASEQARFIILHCNPADWLYSMLLTWPVPSDSGETLLFRKEGNQVVFLNELRHSKNSALRTQQPIQNRELLAARLLRGEAHPDELISGRDYRNIPVIGMIRAVPDTNWYLVAKIDNAELYNEIYKNAIWIALTGLLALFITRAGFVMLRQQEQLILASHTRHTQAERLQALKLLSAIADGSEDAIFAKDLAGRYILFNRAASQFIQKPASEVIGQDDSALFPPDQAEMLMKIGRQIIAEGTTQTHEEILNMPEGERVFLGTKGPLKDEEGKIIGLFGISRDITDKKHAEAVLSESEARFRALVEQSLAGIYILQNNRFCYVNPGFARIFKQDAAQILAMAASDLIIQQDRPIVAEQIRRCMDNELSDIHFSFTGLRRKNLLIELELYGRKVDYQGQPALIGLILDITERNTAEAALRRQTEELRERNAELERFNRAMTGRELDMIELKRQINQLSRQHNLPAPYPQPLGHPPEAPIDQP